MPVITCSEITALQRNPKNVRNICILAHVDHGKTTLADSLIASNGIISSRLAGKLRYMDSREDEQKRGITMKSSAISLCHKTGNEKYLINLIDSPGHIDFSSEVSTAVRLCDGAIVLVDVVEGVCPQTHAVLRQAWLENVKPCLILNKIDRLITELKMSPLEAYLHLQQILEQVNAITATLFTSDVMEKVSSVNADGSKGHNSVSNTEDDQTYDWSSGLEEVDDSSLYFCPDQRNVVFASAIDGWAFGIDHFAELYSQKVGINAAVLKKTLWGDFYLNLKTKRIMKGAAAKAKRPLFVQLILENLWSVYEAVIERRDKEKTEKILASLKLTVPTRDAKYTDSRIYLQAIMRQWLPLSCAVLDMVCFALPGPLELSAARVSKLLSSGVFDNTDAYTEETKQLYEALKTCSSSSESPVIAFVSKMFSVPPESLPKNKRRPLTEEELRHRREKARERHAQRKEAKEGNCEQGRLEIPSEEGVQSAETSQDQDAGNNKSTETFVAFARVFSGTLKKGDTLYVLGPKYDPRNTKALQQPENIRDENRKLQRELEDVEQGINEQLDVFTAAKFTIDNLFLMMGREFEELEEVPAGNVLGINGLADFVLKSATVSSTLACPSFTPMPFEARPIVRVAVEPEQPSSLPLLLRGLKLLNQADPCVQVFVQETGEYVIAVAGEVHLKKCLDDLKQTYAGINLCVSSPIIPFRETIIPPPKIDMVNEEITENVQKDNIQRLPIFMQREIQDWAETIQKSKRLLDFDSKELQEADDVKSIRSTKDNRKAQNISGLIEARTANGSCLISIRAIPLPEKIITLLEERVQLIKTIIEISSEQTCKERREKVEVLQHKKFTKLRNFYDELKSAFQEAGPEWNDAVHRIWSFGPRRVGPNILLNRIKDYNRPTIWHGLISDDQLGCVSVDWNLRPFDNSIVNGFQLATLAGPMCEEPMTGICFSLEQWTYLEDKIGSKNNAISCRNTSVDSVMQLTESNNEKKNEIAVEVPSAIGLEKFDSQQSEDSSTPENHVEFSKSPVESRVPSDTYGPLSGQIISSVKEACLRAFMAQPMRLMAAMYSCDIQTTADVLGRMYGVISKREGRIIKEEMKEGSDIFLVTAVLPVAESFGFAEEIRKKTSGLASPLLYFSHWEVIPVDPFWRPTTEEEYLLYGEKADSDNQALKYVNDVRKRKGLYVEQKTVEFAEKQRTLKKNK